MPAQETINPSAVVPSYPVVERFRYVWVWVGDPDLADPTAVPDMHQMDDPAWAGDPKLLKVERKRKALKLAAQALAGRMPALPAIRGVVNSVVVYPRS